MHLVGAIISRAIEGAWVLFGVRKLKGNDRETCVLSIYAQKVEERERTGDASLRNEGLLFAREEDLAGVVRGQGKVDHRIINVVFWGCAKEGDCTQDKIAKGT